MSRHVKQAFCVTCEIDMVYPGCAGYVAHPFRKEVCQSCFHPFADHNAEKLAELQKSYATDVKLDFAFEDSDEEREVNRLMGTLSSLELGDGDNELDDAFEAVMAPSKESDNKTPSTPSPSSASPSSAAPRTGVCPVCGKDTQNFAAASGYALPCARCPKPPTPPSRRPRRVSSPSSIGSASDLPSKASGATNASSQPPKIQRKKTLGASGRNLESATVMIPPKPLLVQPKGFTAEWGFQNLPDKKCTIVDDDRYAPFYQHYFANGKRKHAIFTGRIPDSEDPVILALEHPQEDESMGQMSVRGLLFTCKPLSKKEDDRWVFLNPELPMKHELREKVPALTEVKWSEVIEEGFSQSLLQYEQKILSNTDRFKFGVLYIKGDQVKDENAMFSNQDGSPEFFHFMDMLGEKVRLKGWDKYSGGLNVKDDTTGEFTYYTTIRGYQIIFHTSVLLPHRETDEQRLDKKRHIGNDVVVIVFCDTEEVMFDPMEIHSQFNHVFVLVVPAGVSASGKKQYRIAVVRKPGVPFIEPKFKYPGVYEEGDVFRELFLTKLINAERLSMYAPDFVRKMYRTRRELMNLTLKDVKTKKAQRTSVFQQVLNSSKMSIKNISSSLQRSSEQSDAEDNRASGSNEGQSEKGHKRAKSFVQQMIGSGKKKDSPDTSARNSGAK